MDIEQELIDYVSTEIAYDRDISLGVDDPLLDGALDSTDVLRLIVFVEERYGIRIADDDLVPESFGSVAALAALVRAKQAS
jgi:acyl carrier protein